MAQIKQDMYGTDQAGSVWYISNKICVVRVKQDLYGTDPTYLGKHVVDYASCTAPSRQRELL